MVSPDKKSTLNFFISIWACALVYMVGVLLAYLLRFSSPEAKRAASFVRYTGTILVLLYLVLLSTIANDDRIFLRTGMIGAVSMICGLTLMMLPMPRATYDAANMSKTVAQYYRGDIKESAARIKDIVDESEKIFLIIQGDDGHAFHWFKYEMAPYRLNGGYWTYSETAIFSPKGLKEYIDNHNYSYLFVYKTDEVFSGRYQEIFLTKIYEKSLYRNTKDGLIKVE